jgi:hypothetical protein
MRKEADTAMRRFIWANLTVETLILIVCIATYLTVR